MPCALETSHKAFAAPRGFPPEDSHSACTPWSVFQDGPNKLASLLIISLFRAPRGALFAVLSRYLFAIGLPLYLAFDDRYHRFTLHYQAELLALARRDYGAVTLSGRPFLGASSAGYHNSARADYHWGCSLFTRRYSGNPR